MMAKSCFIAQGAFTDHHVAGPRFHIERREVIAVDQEHQPAGRSFKARIVRRARAAMHVDLESRGWFVEERRPGTPALRRRGENGLVVSDNLHGIAERMHDHENTLGSCARSKRTRMSSDTAETMGEASAIPATPVQRENTTSRAASVTSAAAPIQTSS